MRQPLSAPAVAFSPWRTAGGLRFRQVQYAPLARQGAHRHAEGTLSLVLAGELEETTAEGVFRARVGSAVVKPPGYRHANHYGPRGARLLQVTPDSDEPLWPEGPLPYSWPDSPALLRKLLVLIDSPRGDVGEAETRVWDLLATLAPTTSRPAQRRPPAWWKAAEQLLRAAPGQSVSVASIARQLGVHPVHLARVCRRQTGQTVCELIRRQRVLAAWQAAGSQASSLAEIALRSGFADQAHMTRDFVRVLGIPPGRLRRLTHASGSAQT